jgi:hypothetical protein
VVGGRCTIEEELTVSITLELDPELAARLAMEAQARGMALEAYLQVLIERAGALESLVPPGLKEFRMTLDALAEGSAQLPPLSSESFSRESIHQDHQ